MTFGNDREIIPGSGPEPGTLADLAGKSGSLSGSSSSHGTPNSARLDATRARESTWDQPCVSAMAKPLQAVAQAAALWHDDALLRFLAGRIWEDPSSPPHITPWPPPTFSLPGNMWRSGRALTRIRSLPPE